MKKIYQENVSVVRRFYENDLPGVNFCNPWFRIANSKVCGEFLCSGTVKIPGAEGYVLKTAFTADRKGSFLLGVGSVRRFQAFCNGRLCCSTLGEGRLYDVFAPENHPFLVPVKKGENILEIHLEPGQRFDPFCCRPLERGALKLPFLLFDPVISHLNTNSLSVICRTAGDVGCAIEYGIRGREEKTLLWDQRGGLVRRRPLHKFFLSHLEPGAEYEYRILMIDPRDPDLKRYSLSYTFTAPPDEKRKHFSFFFTADPQFPSETQRSLLKGLLEAADAGSCDFHVLGGDINSRYSQSRIEKDLIPLMQHYGTGKPLLMLRGNHELRGPEPDNFTDFWGDEEGKSYMMFRFGDTAFLLLDAWENRPSDHPRAKYYSRHNLDEVIKAEEKAFVRQAVNSPLWQKARRRIVLAHGASFSHFDRAGTMFRFLQELTDEHFEGTKPKSAPHLWLAGHTHLYTRSCPGSDETAAFVMPPAPDKSGRNYLFPALTCCGPNAKGLPQLSAFRVDGEENGSLRVRSFLPDGSCFEEILIHEDHTITELLSLPHFIPEKL